MQKCSTATSFERIVLTFIEVAGADEALVSSGCTYTFLTVSLFNKSTEPPTQRVICLTARQYESGLIFEPPSTLPMCSSKDFRISSSGGSVLSSTEVIRADGELGDSSCILSLATECASCACSTWIGSAAGGLRSHTTATVEDWTVLCSLMTRVAQIKWHHFTFERWWWWFQFYVAVSYHRWLATAAITIVHPCATKLYSYIHRFSV